MTKNRKKSFLSELIENLRKNLTEDAVKKFRTEVVQKMESLSKCGNLRVHDSEKGGVLRGPKKRRSPTENSENGTILCQKQYLDSGKLEVPYFRSLFNSDDRKINVGDQVVGLVGYETPLMRKWDDSKNQDISRREVACDLVGITNNLEVLCIEGKVNPNRKATDIFFGILESYAYGICVDYLLSDKHRETFKKEIEVCINDFRTDLDINELTKLKAAFALAAPVEYFQTYFDPQSRKKKSFGELVEEASKLLRFLRNQHNPNWYGFMVISAPCHSSIKHEGDRLIGKKSYIEPFFNEKPVSISLFDNVGDVGNWLAQKR
jgi:hypothetical protein